MVLTKEYIAELKSSNGIAHLVALLHDVKSINFILENLGHLPKDFDAGFLYDLLGNAHPQIRRNAVKNIGKLNGASDVGRLYSLYLTETSSDVRREIVSAIGRQRKSENKALLYNFLNDSDPKIICQAIRALLVFGDDKDVETHLRPLVNHENETVRTVVYKKYFAKDKPRNNVMPHAETFDFLKNVVVNADVLDALKYVPDESVHLTFTSPPYYNARDYSIYPSYQAYLEFLEKVFIETHRITKEGRFLIVNTSPIIIPRVSRAHSSKRYGIPFDLHPYLVRNGWEFIDDIIWLKPEASVKNHRRIHATPQALVGYKPNSVTEYLMVYRKSTERLMDWNMRRYDKKTVEESKVADGYETTNVWKIDPCFSKVYSAIFPAELCKRVIQYYSYKGDLIFDPFAGSGTVGRTVRTLGRLFFLTEKEPVYFDYMKSKEEADRLANERKTKFLTLKQFKKNYKMTLAEHIVKGIITKVMKSQDYRIEIVNLIDAEFLQFAMDFLKKIANAKSASEDITIDWYKKAFTDKRLPPDSIAINSGLNTKTIHNMCGTTRKAVVIEASEKHFNSLYDNIMTLTDLEKGTDVNMRIRFHETESALVCRKA